MVRRITHPCKILRAGKYKWGLDDSTTSSSYLGLACGSQSSHFSIQPFRIVHWSIHTYCWVNNFLDKDWLSPTLLPVPGDRRRIGQHRGRWVPGTASASLDSSAAASWSFLMRRRASFSFLFWQFWRKLGTLEVFWTLRLTPAIRLSVSTVALATVIKGEME